MNALSRAGLRIARMNSGKPESGKAEDGAAG
jgi:hypothetical protein